MFTCWLRNNKLVKSVNGLAIGQLMPGHDQSILGKLISPSIVMLGIKFNGLARWRAAHHDNNK